ncbi:MAG: hypothetical protein WB510_14215, partial [Candidatus Sulfotelmatobacter sp.]
MIARRALFGQLLLLVCAAAILLAGTACTRKSSAQIATADLQLPVSMPFRVVAYGDSRFHDPRDTEAANPAARLALVQAIARVDPSFICLTGDIVYNGYDGNDWKIWDSETST